MRGQHPGIKEDTLSAQPQASVLRRRGALSRWPAASSNSAPSLKPPPPPHKVMVSTAGGCFKSTRPPPTPLLKALETNQQEGGIVRVNKARNHQAEDFPFNYTSPSSVYDAGGFLRQHH